ncbi:pyridoxal phosphate-dependent aminotransferase [Thermodesulfobacteriota bacterium]
MVKNSLATGYHNVHGGNIIATAKIMGCRPDELIDMSSNLNPLGMATGLKDRLIHRMDEIEYLPETGSESLCEAFAGKYSLSPDQILVGNGTTEFIFAVPQTFPCDRAVIVSPTYSDYQLACHWAGVEVQNFHLDPAQDFQPDLGALGKTLSGGEVVILCNPNNPSGRLIPSGALHDFICRHRSTLFLVDETYLPFIPEPSLIEFPLSENLLVLRSFSKIFSIAGLRLGFLVASADNILQMQNRRKPWGVNRLAQIAGEYLLEHGDQFIDRVRKMVNEQRLRFVEELHAVDGLQVVPGVAHFILCKLLTISAAVLHDEMLQYRIMVRNCEDFIGLSESYFRISLKDEKRNAQCLAALRKVLGGI